MKPANLDVDSPRSLHEALELLRDREESVKILAGGQSLLPVLNLRLAYVDRLVSLERVSELRGVQMAGHSLEVGALTTHQTALDLADEIELGLWEDALSQIGHRTIRNRGTVGGSLAHADPAAEWPAVALTLGARCAISAIDSNRSVLVDDLVSGIFTTTLGPDEVITAVTFERPQTVSGSSCIELSRRPGDFAMAGAATLLAADDDDRLVDARITIFGVEGRPRRMSGAIEDDLLGQVPDEDLFAAVGALVAAEIEPVGDDHGDARFKRAATGELVGRSLRRSWERRLERSGQ